MERRKLLGGVLPRPNQLVGTERSSEDVDVLINLSLVIVTSLFKYSPHFTPKSILLALN